MKVGTKSVLIGAHCFFIHPWFVAVAWWKLYGFPADYRLWIAFMLHDLGYWGKPNMDGPEGEAHVEWAANLMARWFGPEWGDFCRYHSRFYAKRDGKPFSRLCVADKLAMALEPWWLYLFRVWASGEVYEYMTQANNGKYTGENRDTTSMRRWHRSLCEYMLQWVEVHKDGAEDTWTPVQRRAEG